MSDQQVRIPPGTPLTITLSVVQMQHLLSQLAQGKYADVGPLIGEIERQCHAQLERIVPTLRANGQDHSNAERQ